MVRNYILSHILEIVTLIAVMANAYLDHHQHKATRAAKRSLYGPVR